MMEVSKLSDIESEVRSRCGCWLVLGISESGRPFVGGGVYGLRLIGSASNTGNRGRAKGSKGSESRKMMCGGESRPLCRYSKIDECGLVLGCDVGEGERAMGAERSGRTWNGAERDDMIRR